MNDRDRALQLAERSIARIADDAFAEQHVDGSEAQRLAFTLGTLSEDGLERVEAWLAGMLRQHPLDASPLFTAHRVLIESVLDDVRAEMSRRGSHAERQD